MDISIEIIVIVIVIIYVVILQSISFQYNKLILIKIKKCLIYFTILWELRISRLDYLKYL